MLLPSPTIVSMQPLYTLTLHTIAIEKTMGPLKGYKIVEFGSIGPTPYCAMLLADMGAQIVRIDRTEAVELGLKRNPGYEINRRNRPSIRLDVKAQEGREAALRLIASADALIEGFRPGVMERLGLGPDVCLAANPKLVYGRMTGWGQEGPLAQTVGHDINYIALAGALHYLGPKGGAPLPPLALVGDHGGGGLWLAFGMVCALLEARRSGLGQVVDGAIIDGVTSLLTPMHGRFEAGGIGNSRGENANDGSRPWYCAYETRDGKWISIGAIEGRFYAELLNKLGLDKEDLPKQHDAAGWPRLHSRFAEVFKQKTRDQWVALLEGTDVCFAPVLDLGELREHPHVRARGMFTEFEGVTHPVPGPRMSRTPPEIRSGPEIAGAHTESALAEWGFSPTEISALKKSGVIA